MKKGIAVLVFMGLIVGTILVVANQRNADEQYKRSWAKNEREMQQITADMKSELLAERIRFVRQKFDAADAATFELCHTSPPTTEEHKKECELLDRRVKKAEDESAKHPW